MSDLGTDGYLVLDRLLDADAVAAVRTAVADALERHGPRGPGGTLHVDDLAGPAVDAVWTAPPLVAAVAALLGPHARRGTLHLRAPHPGFGAQALHADFGGPPPADAPHVVVAVVALVDVAEDGGATRVVPGTHRWNRTAPGDTVDRTWPGERRVPLRAGDALVFDGHLWHSGTRNRTDARRDALQVTWRRS